MLFSALRAAIFRLGLVVPGAKPMIRRAVSVESSGRDLSADLSYHDRGLEVSRRIEAAETLLQTEDAAVFDQAR
jgi:hypothetical protein